MSEVKFDEPIDAYHADKEYHGSSRLKKLHYCRRLFLEPDEGGTSVALTLGTHWHSIRELGWKRWENEAAILTPDEFVTASGAVSTSKAARAWRDDFPDRTPVTPLEHVKLRRMSEMFDANSAAVKYEADAAHREPSIRWRDGSVGLRVRPDLVTKSGRLVDYKTISDANPLSSFRFNVRKYCYGLSDVLYQRGCEQAGLAEGPMVFVVTSTVAPYSTQVFSQLDESTRGYWDVRLDELIEELRNLTHDVLPIGYGREHICEC